MGHSRPRYNEKGRAVQRQTGKRKRTEDYQLDDSNADILDPELRKKRRAEVRLSRFSLQRPRD